MWEKQPIKRRRSERERVLDMKLRSRRTRVRSLRIFGKFLMLMFGLATGLTLFWRGGEWILNQFVFKNAAFNVERVVVQTDGVIPAEQLRHWAGVRRGDNLLGIDLFRIQRDLELQPWIKDAVVERILPSTLRIRVTEREPVAQVPAPESHAALGLPTAYLIDAEGYVMFPPPRLEAAELAEPEVFQLPELAGLPRNAFRPGRRMESRQVHDGLRFILAFRESPMWGLADVRSVDISIPQVLIVRTKQGAEITFSTTRLETQLRRWRMVHDFAAAGGRGIATLDLSVTNNVPARWREASLEPAVPPQTLKPSPYRKKHV